MKTPAASLIITVENQWNFTRKCLKSLAAHTDKQTIEVIVVDNASTDETPRGCPFLGGSLFGAAFRYIRNDEKLSLAAAANAGAALAEGRYLIFLDPKTEVQPGWYEPLLDDFSAWPDLGATAPLLADAVKTPLGLTVRHLGVYLGPVLKTGRRYE
ncbi:MAG: glycosyltransferase, partial [Desulfovibrio sp.]|nr:glycosyltransferase [Desulfovibrio sp.]